MGKNEIYEIEFIFELNFNPIIHQSNHPIIRPKVIWDSIGSNLNSEGDKNAK